MKELLNQYAQYNIWANKLVIDAILALPTDASDMTINSSFPTIKATVAHIYGAEDVWRQRMEHVAHPIWNGEFNGPITEVCARWQQASADIAAFVAAQTEATLSAPLSYTDRRGNAYNNTPAQILHHVFNHSTYHRGQLITMLRQAGATNIPGTDFIGFVRL